MPRPFVVDILQRGLGRCSPYLKSVHGVVFRTVAVRYANRDDVLTGAGSKRCGGRWNPLGSFHTLYFSFDVETALAEYTGQLANFGFAAAAKTPFVTTAVEILLDRVLDLTNATVRSKLEVTLRRMKEDDWKSAQVPEGSPSNANGTA